MTKRMLRNKVRRVEARRRQLRLIDALIRRHEMPGIITWLTAESPLMTRLRNARQT